MSHLTECVTSVQGPFLFFLSALGINMVGKTYGSKQVSEHFADLVSSQGTETDAKTSYASIVQKRVMTNESPKMNTLPHKLYGPPEVIRLAAN